MVWILCQMNVSDMSARSGFAFARQHFSLSTDFRAELRDSRSNQRRPLRPLGGGSYRPRTSQRVCPCQAATVGVQPLCTTLSDRLLGRADEELVDAYALGLGYGVDYGARDVFGLQPLQSHEAA